MKVTRKIIRIDEELCNGCGECVPGCAEAALQIVDGKAKLVAEKYCDGLGACLGECPTGALTLEERVVEEYDHDAVEERVEELARRGEAPRAALHKPQQTPPASGGCPGRGMMTMQPAAHASKAGAGASETPEGEKPSYLAHWPVQLRLVPPNAPFLKDAEVLIVADCVPVALPDFHARFVPGKVILMGCPKFDDAQAYVEKIAGILTQGQPKSITLLEMEVPCCQSLDHIMLHAAKAAGNPAIPAEKIIISRDGKILSKHRLGASPF